MAFWFHCPNCRSNRVATDGVIGHVVACPDCQKSVVVAPPEKTTMIPDEQLEKTPDKVLDETSIIAVAPEGSIQPRAAISVAEYDFDDDDDDDDEDLEPLAFSTEREETEMDMTPMVDVTFLLLIFFIVTASFTVQKAMGRPTNSNEPSMNQSDEDDDPPNIIQVDINEFNTFFVVGESDEVEAPSEQDLRIALRRMKEEATSEVKLLIRAHKEAHSGLTVTVLDVGTDLDFQMDVRVVDEL